MTLAKKMILGSALIGTATVAVVTAVNASDTHPAPSMHCFPNDGMPIVGCVPGEAERVKASGHWRIDPDMIVWIR
jgi:hypothetical protein